MCKGWMALGLTALWVAGCGAADAPTKKETSRAAAVDTQVDVRQARKLLYRAEEALEGGRLERARELLRQADTYADSRVREDIRVTAERVDEADAKRLVPGAVEIAQEGDCAQALEDTAKLVVLANRGRGFPTLVRQLTRDANVECLEAMMADEARLPEVRELLATTTARQALGKTVHAELETALDEAAIAVVMSSLDEPLRERRWDEVLTGLAALVKAGKASEADQAQIVELVREGLTKDVEAVMSEAMEDEDGRGSGEALRRADELLAIGWGPSARVPDKAQAAPPPSRLVEARKKLAFRSVCWSLRCRTTAPAPMWTYGKVPTFALLEPTGKPAGELLHATAVWQIAQATSKVLVVASDPGELSDGLDARVRADAVWVEAAALRSSDTAKWLPPGQALVGTRVWGPLRPPEKLLEAGKVLAVDGARATVQRVSDRQQVTVSRTQLHFGTLAKGIKVLALCGGIKLQTALIEQAAIPKHASQGDPVLTVQCLDRDGSPDGPTRQQLLGSLRTRPEWLPPRR